MKSTLNEFKAFILRGNVVDLAIAVVIGAAFGAVVTALVKDIITPLIAAIGGQPNFANLTFTINNSQILVRRLHQRRSSASSSSRRWSSSWSSSRSTC